MWLICYIKLIILRYFSLRKRSIYFTLFFWLLLQRSRLFFERSKRSILRNYRVSMDIGLLLCESLKIFAANIPTCLAAFTEEMKSGAHCRQALLNSWSPRTIKHVEKVHFTKQRDILPALCAVHVVPDSRQVLHLNAIAPSPQPQSW